MSQRDGYEHGVPSWIAGAHPEPAEAAAFYTELFGWQADTRGDHLVCTLRGRDVAGFVPGRRRRLAHERLGRERRRDRRARPRGRRQRRHRARSTLPGVGRTAVARRPRRRRVHRLRARPPPRRPGRQRAGRVGDERALHARPRERQGVLRRRLRLGDRQLRPRSATLCRLPGFVGGEPAQPVPARPRRGRLAGRDAAVGRRLLGRRRRRHRRARRRARRRVSCRPPTTPIGRTPSSPTRRARPSPSAAWCPHEHDRGRQPRHARRRHAGARRPRRGPPRRLRARRLGHASTSTRSRASTWARGWASGGGALLFGRWTYEKMQSAWSQQPEDNPVRQVLERSTKYVVSRSDAPARVGELGAAPGRRGETVADLKARTEGNLVILGSAELIHALLPARPDRRVPAHDPPARAGQRASACSPTTARSRGSGSWSRSRRPPAC